MSSCGSEAAGGLPVGPHSHLGSGGSVAPQGSAPSPLNAGMLVRGQNPLLLMVLGRASLPLRLVKVDFKAKTVEKLRGGKGAPNISPDTSALQHYAAGRG